MKKWFACLAVAGLLFSAGVGVSHAESWYPLNTDADGRTGYIDNDTVEKDDAQAKLNLKIVDPSGDHSIYTLQFNRAAKTAKLLEMKVYNPAGYMIGGQTYDNTDIQIQEGNNQNSMQSVNLGQIEQLVKNVASGDGQTSFGGQTSNAGGYHPEEPVHDVDIEEDITSREVKKRPLIDQPQDPEALERMMRLTTARIGVGCAGPRLKTQTLLTLRADHARARDAVMLDVHQDVIDNLKLFSVQTRCQDKNEFLTRPDLGRRLSEDGVQKVKDQCIEGPDVQLIVADGLSSTAINANIENVLPVLMDGLSAAGLRVGTPFFVRYGRVAVEDEIAELVGAKVVCIFVGERPGLGTAESMSAYLAYNAKIGMPEARRTVVSNIHKDGITAVEAGAYLTDLIQKILDKKASGVELQN